MCLYQPAGRGKGRGRGPGKKEGAARRGRGGKGRGRGIGKGRSAAELGSESENSSGSVNSDVAALLDEAESSDSNQSQSSRHHSSVSECPPDVEDPPVSEAGSNSQESGEGNQSGGDKGPGSEHSVSESDTDSSVSSPSSASSSCSDSSSDTENVEGLEGDVEFEFSAEEGEAGEHLPVLHAYLGVGNESGAIRYKATDNSLCAHCTIHEDCRTTRTCRESKRKNKFTGQGRPLGYLAAWLYNAERFKSKREHRRYRPTFTERWDARCDFLSERGAWDLVPLERDPFPFETDEPPTFQSNEKHAPRHS